MSLVFTAPRAFCRRGPLSRGGGSASLCSGFSHRVQGPGCAESRVEAHGLSFSMAYGIFLGQGSNLCLPALAGDLLHPSHQGSLVAFFFFSFHILAISYDTCLSLCGLIHLARSSLGPSALLQMTSLDHFSRLRSIPLCIRSPSSLSITLSMDS